MNKVTILVLLLVFNFGAAGSDLIFYDGFESGWPNAWAATDGWSPFHVMDSTDTLVGPVMGWWTDGQYDSKNPSIPLVAVRIGGEKVIFKLYRGGNLHLSIPVYFELTGCSGQAKIQYLNQDTTDIAALRGAIWGQGPGNIIYKATGPALSDPTYLSHTIQGGDAVPTCTDSSGDLGFHAHWDAVPVVDLDDLFTPPFTVE